MRKSITLMVCAAALAGSASAEKVLVEITGSWDFGRIRSGVLDGVSSGAASTSFMLDSTDFVDSGLFPTRGYNIIQDSFSLTVGGITVGMPNPFPAGETPLFVLRDNDPAVDGFFLGSSVDGFPNGVSIDNEGRLDPYLKTIFSATYGNDPLSSLDILDAVGTYTFDGLTVFNWGFEDAGLQIAGMIFDEFTITVVPAPGALAMLGLGGLMATRRRRA